MKDYLIIGQGLAGISITNQLMQHNKTCLAVEDRNQISATSVAAGMFNPLVFRRITKSWMIDDLLPEMYNTYTSLEKRLNKQLIFRKPIIKLITKDEYTNWVSKSEDPSIKKYILDLKKGIHINGVSEYYASAKIANSGYIDLNELQKSFQQELTKNESIVYDSFNYNDLSIHASHITWKGTNFKNIIFCEGAFAVNNPLFQEVAYKLTKGDVLTLDIENMKLEYIVNKMVFILEKSKGEFLCGSTYNWSGLDFTPNEADRNQLTKKLTSILNKPFKVRRHQVAVRPTVTDRRPVLGTHYKYKNVHYFNGLGTKGVMLAPYFSKQMINYLENNEPLQHEVNINRFWKQ